MDGHPVGTMASLGDGVGDLPRHSEGPEGMAEDGPGIQDRKSFTVFTLELDWASSGEADEKFSCLAVLFCSAEEEGVAGQVFSADCKTDEFSADSRVNLSADCGRVVWSIDEEGFVRFSGVLSPDDEIDDDCLAVDKEHF